MKIPLTKKTNFSVECDTGTFSANLNFTQFGLVRLGRNKNHILNNFDQSCTDWASFLYSIQDCHGEKNCDFEFNESWILKKCSPDESEIGFIRLFCSSIFFFNF